jgi:hypothetical protein
MDKLKYGLSENNLTPAANDYIAQVVDVHSYSIEEIAERMLDRGTMLTKADILAVIEVFFSEIVKIVENGGAVHTPIFNLMPGISGVFQGMLDSFDPARHKIKAHITAGVLILQVIEKIKVTKVALEENVPHIHDVKDFDSGTENEQLSPGGPVQIYGNRLRFCTDEPTNGVFVIDEHNVETQCGTVMENKPSQIIIMLPQTLAQGNYVIEVRTNYSTNGKLKNLRKGRFSKTLIVK